MYPRYWTWVMLKVNFSTLAHNLCCRSVWRTCRMWWRCSSQLWLKIRMSSKYTNINELVNGYKMSSISLVNVAGKFINPKSITNHSKRPSLALKAVFHTSEGSIGTWWYPDFKSILLKYLPPSVGPRGHQSMGSGNYYGQWSCSAPDSQYRVSMSHPSSVPTWSSSHKVMKLDGCELSTTAPESSSWFHHSPEWSANRLVH